MSTLSNLLHSLTNAGASQSVIQATVQGLAALSPTSTIQSICTVILANSNNPAVIKDEATKLAETPNLPVAVANLLPSLQVAAAANNPMQVIQVVQAIETAMGGGGLQLGAVL
jgi:hypothetical protein